MKPSQTTGSSAKGLASTCRDAGAQGRIVTKITEGIEFLFKKNKIDLTAPAVRRKFVAAGDAYPIEGASREEGDGAGEARHRRHRLEGAALPNVRG